MKPEEYFSVLDEHHVDYDRDYVGSLSRDHNSNNIFIRFVANVKFKRFFEYVLSRRSEPKARQALRDISKRLTELIIEDWKKLDSQEEFEPYRSRPYSHPFYDLVFKDNSRVIRFDEGEFKNLFGSDCWKPYFKNAVREYWRLDQEPRLLNTDIWELEDIKKNYALYEEDLQEFKSNPKPITQPQTTENNPPELQEPTRREWKYERQYLGYAVSNLIDKNDQINVKQLCEEVAQYFYDKKGKSVSYSTIKTNFYRWENQIKQQKKQKSPIKYDAIEKAKQISVEERDNIRAVIDYFIKKTITH
jgi:hypothetical protein